MTIDASKLTTLYNDIDLIHQIAHGLTTVTTENGQVRSISKLLEDSQGLINSTVAAMHTILTISGPPSNSLGSDGDYAYDPSSKILYGPKDAGVWYAGTLLKGPTGPLGGTGPTGPSITGPTGASITGPTGAIGPTGPSQVQQIESDVTSSFTLGVAHAEKLVPCNSASTINVTVPADSTVNFVVGTTVSIFRKGTGAVVFLADTGVTLRTPSSLAAKAQWSRISCTKLSSNTWLVSGDLL